MSHESLPKNLEIFDPGEKHTERTEIAESRRIEYRRALGSGAISRAEIDDNNKPIFDNPESPIAYTESAVDEAREEMDREIGFKIHQERQKTELAGIQMVIDLSKTNEGVAVLKEMIKTLDGVKDENGETVVDAQNQAKILRTINRTLHEEVSQRYFDTLEALASGEYDERRFDINGPDGIRLGNDYMKALTRIRKENPDADLSELDKLARSEVIGRALQRDIDETDSMLVGAARHNLAHKRLLDSQR